MQPRTPEEEIRRAGKAKQILEDEVFKDAVTQVQEALLSGMRNAGIADDKLRLRMLDMYQGLYSILTVLQSTMETGTLAKEQLELQQKRSAWQSLKDRFG